jgi:hypothetical protein
MQTLVHTDNHIVGREAMIRDVTAAVEGSLASFADHLTRVDVYLSDKNAHKKGGDDISCRVEVRPAGLKAFTAEHSAPGMMDAVDGAADRAVRILADTFDRKHNPKGRTSMAGDEQLI